MSRVWRWLSHRILCWVMKKGRKAAKRSCFVGLQKGRYWRAALLPAQSLLPPQKGLQGPIRIHWNSQTFGGLSFYLLLRGFGLHNSVSPLSENVCPCSALVIMGMNSLYMKGMSRRDSVFLVNVNFLVLEGNFASGRDVSELITWHFYSKLHRLAHNFQKSCVSML